MFDFMLYTIIIMVGKFGEVSNLWFGDFFSNDDAYWIVHVLDAWLHDTALFAYDGVKAIQ